MDSKEEKKEERLDVSPEAAQAIAKAVEERAAQTRSNDEEDDDSDMPVQKTRQYKQVVFTKPLYATLLHKVIDGLPYNTVFRNGNSEMKLTDLAKMMLPATGQVDVPIMNQCISMLVSLPYAQVREFMSYIESPQKQQEIWEVKTL